MNHIRDIAADYALGLLSSDKNNEVIEHISLCEGCRFAVAKEREFIKNIKSTYQQATEFDEQRVRVLMPSPPERADEKLRSLIFRPVLAALMIFFVAVGGLLLESDLNSVSNIQSTKLHSIATFTQTEAPTYTSTATTELTEKHSHRTVESQPPIPGFSAPNPEITPEPTQLGS